jgi:tetratricopeptide (TPR) repeat protein
MFARRFWRRTVAAAAALIAVASLGGCGKGAPPPPPPSAAKPVQKAEIAGVNLYRQALATQDGDESLGLLEQAVRTNPRLTEAWYELGRFKVKRATILIKTDELQAVQMFREGLGAEQEALRLLDDGKVTVWSAAEQEEARAALQTDLRDAEEAMTGPEALLSALRQRTY